MKTRVLVLFTLLFAVLTAQSQNKSVEAVKTLQVPKIDGNLDDAAWVNATILTGFIQNSPNVGEPATKKTEVRIVYDNAAIYIGAYLYDEPS
jgi:hypothetical protein